jgi:hypothetical protein
MCAMARKHHHMPLSGGDRKALKKELSKSRAMTHIFAERSAEKRREGEALIREADNLACQSWNEKMWSDGGPIDALGSRRILAHSCLTALSLSNLNPQPPTADGVRKLALKL